MTRGFYRVNLKPGEVWVNQAERLYAFHIALQHPNVRSALDKVAHDLTKNGFMFMQGRQVLAPSFEFENQIKENWIPCTKDSVFSIAAQGVLPLYSYTDKESGQSVTVCPQFETYKLSISYLFGRPVIRFWWINPKPTSISARYLTEYVDPSVQVISGFGYDPGRDGRLNSLVSSLFPTVNFIDNMLAYATRAENKNTDPTLVVTEDAPKPGNMEAADAEVPYSFFVDCDPCEDKEEDRYYAEELEARLNRFEVDAEAEAVEEQKSRLGMKQQLITASLFNRIKLKPGQGIGTQPLPRPRTDLVPLIDISKSTVSQVFKIPQDMFSGTVSGRTAHDTAGFIMAQYRETLRGWARFLEPIVTSIYSNMYEAQDRRYFKRIVNDKLKHWMPTLAQELSQIRVIINFSHGIGREELEYGVNRGLLDYKIMAELWLTQNGLPKELLAHEKDILSDQTKRDMLLGTLGKPKSGTPATATKGKQEEDNHKEKGEKDSSKKRQREDKSEDSSSSKKQAKTDQGKKTVRAT